MRQHERCDQRPGERTGLVHRLVQAERPALPDLLAGAAHHRVRGGIAHRLASAFQNDQQRRDPPGARQRHQRNGQHLDGVTRDRNRPVESGAINDAARHEAQQVASELAGAGNGSDDRPRSAERGEEWP
jgi:hypothetical protein